MVCCLVNYVQCPFSGTKKKKNRCIHQNHPDRFSSGSKRKNNVFLESYRTDSFFPLKSISGYAPDKVTTV